MIENAQRDRRWCQGNLQHGLVLFAKGLRGVSRLHLALGICGYLSGPLWLAFLLTFNWIYWFQQYTGLSHISRSLPAFTPYLNLSGTAHALLIFVICMVVILLPKLLALLDLAHDWPRRRAFGGLGRATAGVVWPKPFSPRCTRRCKCSGTRASSSPTCSAPAWAGCRPSAIDRRHVVALCDPAALGTHAHRAGLGRVHVAAGPDAVLVVHAGAGGHGAVRAVERADQPAAPRRAVAENGAVPHAGGNRAAAGTGFPAVANENARAHRPGHPKPGRAARTPAWPRPCSILTSTPSTSRCCAKSSSTPPMPSSWPNSAPAARRSARSAKNCSPSARTN